MNSNHKEIHLLGLAPVLPVKQIELMPTVFSK